MKRKKRKKGTFTLPIATIADNCSKSKPDLTDAKQKQTTTQTKILTFFCREQFSFVPRSPSKTPLEHTTIHGKHFRCQLVQLVSVNEPV